MNIERSDVFGGFVVALYCAAVPRASRPSSFMPLRRAHCIREQVVGETIGVDPERAFGRMPQNSIPVAVFI